MRDKLLIFYAFIVVGIFDFILIPRFLIFLWNRKKETPPFASKLILVLRITGFFFILLAFLIKFTNLF